MCQHQNTIRELLLAVGMLIENAANKRIIGKNLWSSKWTNSTETVIHIHRESIVSSMDLHTHTDTHIHSKSFLCVSLALSLFFTYEVYSSFWLFKWRLTQTPHAHTQHQFNHITYLFSMLSVMWHQLPHINNLCNGNWSYEFGWESQTFVEEPRNARLRAKESKWFAKSEESVKKGQ